MRKKVSYDELISGKRFSSYQDEVDYIMRLIGQGELEPVKSSPKNGKRPALYTRYWKIIEDRDYSDYIDELRGRISARIEIDYYLNHLDIYVKERPYVLQLSEYLEKHQAELQVPISENERSFAIWKQEKFLSGRLDGGVSANDVLKHCMISRELLNIYKTAEPLAYYSHSKKTPQNILILENLDPFYGMRRYMLGGKDSICGITFGTLVYGGGKRVSRAFADFELLAEPYLTAGDNRFYYLGDIDLKDLQSRCRKSGRFCHVFHSMLRCLIRCRISKCFRL